MEKAGLFQFQNAVKSFGERTVLDDFNWGIREGDFVVLLGPSGCGKSTVLRLLAGLEDLSSGALRSPLAPNLSFVFQDPRLLPWRTVEENVLLPFELRRSPAPDPRYWLEKVGLWDARSLYPHQLSGGMRMRASLARALMTEPDVLLLDEPLAALDEVTREDLQEFLRGLWLEKRFTTVFVTHSLREASVLAERLVIMSRGGGKILHDERLNISRSGSELQDTVERLSDRFRHVLREDR